MFPTQFLSLNDDNEVKNDINKKKEITKNWTDTSGKSKLTKKKPKKTVE